MVSGQWSVVSGQWSVVSGQWSVVSGQWSVVSGQWSAPTLPPQGNVCADCQDTRGEKTTLLPSTVGTGPCACRKKCKKRMSLKKHERGTTGDSPFKGEMYGHWLLIEAKGFLTVCENRNKSHKKVKPFAVCGRLRCDSKSKAIFVSVSFRRWQSLALESTIGGFFVVLVL